jgi:threonine dehydrogenase-like Zn-dependent dehydrogenase
MRAIIVTPGSPHSAELVDWPEPRHADGEVLVETIAVGVCGTDAEIIEGLYGSAPPGEQRLVLGHESLGRVLEAPPDTGLGAGDLVVPMVRRPDPEPCANCAVGEWDMCRNGRFTEHGIKERHGFARDRFRVEAERLVPIDPRLGDLGVLLEPASILAKAWEQIERIGQRSRAEPHRALVTGAGPIGLLAAMFARQRGLEVDVLDRTTDGPKPGLVKDLGATYYANGVAEIKHCPDIVVECTGAPQLVFDVMTLTNSTGIVCLTGVSSGGRKISVDVADLNKTMVLENDVVFGSVNANRRHYEAAAQALARADRNWLGRLITRRVPVESWKSAVERQAGDVKTVIDFRAG